MQLAQRGAFDEGLFEARRCARARSASWPRCAPASPTPSLTTTTSSHLHLHSYRNHGNRNQRSWHRQPQYAPQAVSPSVLLPQGRPAAGQLTRRSPSQSGSSYLAARGHYACAISSSVGYRRRRSRCSYAHSSRRCDGRRGGSTTASASPARRCASAARRPARRRGVGRDCSTGAQQVRGTQRYHWWPCAGTGECCVTGCVQGDEEALR